MESSHKSSVSKYILGATLSLILSGCGGGSPLTLNQQNYDKIQDDMSQAEVTAILGQPTDTKSEPIPIVGGTQTTDTWSSDKAQVVIIFKNDKVKDKNSHFSD